MVDERNLKIVKRKSYSKHISAFLFIIFLYFIYSLVENPRFGWNIVGKYLFNEAIMSGLLLAVCLTVICMVIGVILGIIIAFFKVSNVFFLEKIAQLYIWFFRGTPILVQLIFWYNLSALYPSLYIHIPFLDVDFFKFTTNDLITPLIAAILGLSLNEGAYMSEIVRGGILSVDSGQEEAATSLGMKKIKIMLRIILPQAMRTIIPPTGNETIGMLKMTSLVSVISLSDLLYAAQSIYSRNFETIPLLLVTCFWYLVMTTIMTFFQEKVERHYHYST